jgi:hypothetical protein
MSNAAGAVRCLDADSIATRGLRGLGNPYQPGEQFRARGVGGRLFSSAFDEKKLPTIPQQERARVIEIAR